jgi:dienelactone hydrolase
MSGGGRIVGQLYRPTGTAAGAIVLTGPLTSVKEQATGNYARELAQRGWAALAFDHRHFGESDGEPRQLENPLAKVQDVHAAMDALREDPRTRGLRQFAIGICAGAGYMARAVAETDRLTGFAAVAGFYQAADEASIAAAAPALARARAAEQGWLDRGEAMAIPAVAPGGGDVAMPLREAFEYYGTPRGAHPNYVNAYAVQSGLYTIPFNAQREAARIGVPFLMIHSEKALAPTLARRFFAGVTSRHAQSWMESRGQIDFYDDPTLIQPACAAIVDWFAAAA